MKIAAGGTIDMERDIYTLLHMSITITMLDNSDVECLIQFGFQCPECTRHRKASCKDALDKIIKQFSPHYGVRMFDVLTEGFGGSPSLFV